MKRYFASFLAVALMMGSLIYQTQTAQAATCTNSVGPGIPPPASVPSGIPGYHAAWYGQSGYPTLCPGAKATSVVAYYNSGSAGWLQGAMGQAAYLGTWSPQPGQDQPSPLGGDGTNGTPNTGWPRYNRIAQQPTQWVGPGQVSWFQFTIQAPTTPGYYKLYLRPLIEGATWMEDYGVFWQVTVLQSDGTYPVPAPYSGCRNWPNELGTLMAKAPTRADNCLLPYASQPPACNGDGGCYLPNTPPMMAVTWVTKLFDWSHEVFVTAHELCHSHQDWRNIQEGYPGSGKWEATTEGIAFASAWNAYMSSSGTHPFPVRESLKEDFGDVCAGWYYPYGTEITANYPALASFAQQWLAK